MSSGQRQEIRLRIEKHTEELKLAIGQLAPMPEATLRMECAE